MDFSKYAMAVLSTNITDVQELINIKENYSKSINSIFIPTTHGTGSEVTKWATIWDMDKKRKKSLSNESLYPDFAILDGSLLTTLPESVSIATILDALSHSFEALWNKTLILFQLSMQ